MPDDKKNQSNKPNKPNESNTPVKPKAKSDTVKKAVKLSASLQKIIDQIEKLSVLELSELVKALEDKFGVSAAAPVVVAGGTPAAAGGETTAVEEKSSYTVVLAASGTNKIAVIKALREVKPDLGLKDAKDLSDQAPKTVLENATKEQAADAKQKLEAAGAQVELK